MRFRTTTAIVSVLLFILAATACHPARTAREAVAPPQRLNIATWNIEWLNREERAGRVPRDAQDYARLAAYARRLDADLVALQEVDGEAAAARVFDPNVYNFHFTSDEGNLQRTGFAYKKWLHVVVKPDVVSLAVSGTRRGADILVTEGARQLRVLSIHLKSGCWGDPLRTVHPPCDVLREQLPILEGWIDARAREGAPFAVLGDFNRRFEPGDEFWAEIDDGDPPDARLTDMTKSRVSECWSGEYPIYIDHLVFSRKAAQWLIPESFRQSVFDSRDAPFKNRLSDHCPVAVSLALGGPR